MTSNSMNTSNLTSINGHRMTKEEVQQKSDAELLQMINQAKGHTGIDFSDYMHCDFSYSYLTGLLRDRGYENGWHKVTNAPATAQKPTVIQMKKSEGVCHRQSFMIEDSIAAEWKNFNEYVPYKTVTLGWALKRFMDDVRSDRIKFELEI